MINKNYVYDGKALLNLNEVQEKYRNIVNNKINNKEYVFEDAICPVCSNKNFELLSEKDRYGLYMPVVICKICGLVQSSPRMNQESFNLFYDNEYRKLYVGSEIPQNDFFSMQYNRGKAIYDYIKNNGITIGETIIEIGCGAGGVLKYFKDNGHNVIGYDLGTEYINYGKNQYNLDLFTGTIETTINQLNIKPNLIIYSHVFEHILDPNKELEQIKKLLAIDALLYIEVPGIKNIHNNYNNFLKYLQNAHVYHYTLRTLNNIMNKNGYKMKCGNEVINSLFYLTNTFNVSFYNDYSNVMKYLKKTDYLKNINRLVNYLKARLKNNRIKKFFTKKNKKDYL